MLNIHSTLVIVVCILPATLSSASLALSSDSLPNSTESNVDMLEVLTAESQDITTSTEHTHHCVVHNVQYIGRAAYIVHVHTYHMTCTWCIAY